jgi:hypothetical protein
VVIRGTGRAVEGWRSAAPYLKGFFAATARQKSRMVHKAPLDDLQAAALAHLDPFRLLHTADRPVTAIEDRRPSYPGTSSV